MPLIKIALNAMKAREMAKDIGRKLGITALAVPVAMSAAKVIHSDIVDKEPDEDIRVPLSELATRKEKMQAVRTSFADRFKEMNLPIVDDSKTTVSAGRSMFPWKDSYTTSVELFDRDGEPTGEWGGYNAKVYKDKDGHYTGGVEWIFTRDEMQGKGVGRGVENRMVQAFGDLGATKSRMLPAFDGPLVWAKKDFGYHIDPDTKPIFLKAYARWAKVNGKPFEDLGDEPGNYPPEFLKDIREHVGFRNVYYEKPIEKQASGGLAKLAASFDARRNKQYWQLLKKMYGGNDEAISAIKATEDPGIYHATNEKNIDSILRHGIYPGEYFDSDLVGKGPHFAPKNVANGYGNALVRMKYPSELAGTEELYPRTEDAMALNMGNRTTKEWVGRRWTGGQNQNKRDELIQSIEQHLGSMSEEERAIHVNQWWNGVQEQLPPDMLYPRYAFGIDHEPTGKLSTLDPADPKKLASTMGMFEFLKDVYGKDNLHKTQAYGKHPKWGQLYEDQGDFGQVHFDGHESFPPELLVSAGKGSGRSSGELRSNGIAQKVRELNSEVRDIPSASEPTPEPAGDSTLGKLPYGLLAGAAVLGIGAKVLHDKHKKHKKRSDHDARTS